MYPCQFLAKKHSILCHGHGILFLKISLDINDSTLSLPLSVIDKLNRQKEAVSPERCNAKGTKRRLSVHCLAYGCANKMKNVRREATQELRRTREKEKKEGTRRVASFFRACTHRSR